MASRRAGRRYEIQLDVAAHGPGVTLIGHTVDIGRYGLLVASQEPRRAGELTQLWIRVNDSDWIHVLAVVARILPDLPGFGVRLHMMGGAEKRLWDDLLASLGDEGGADRSLAPATSARAASLPRFLVRPRRQALMEKMGGRELSLGGMFLRTPLPHKVGTAVEVLLIHPDTERAFPLTGEVVVEQREGPLHERGNGVLFTEWDPAAPILRQRFAAFCTEQIADAEA